MALAVAVQGAKRPSQVISWPVGDVPLNLSGATITGKIASPYSGTRDIVGALTVTDAAGGVFTWIYDDADVAEAGRFLVQFTAAFGSEPSPARNFMEEWVVEGSA